MRIIYRMRGLLGDATEEFIESLDSTTGNALVSWKLGLDLKSEVRCRAVTLLSPQLTVDWRSLCCIYLLHLAWRRIWAALQVCALNTNTGMACGCSAWPFIFLLLSPFKFDTVNVTWTVGKCALLCSGFAFMIRLWSCRWRGRWGRSLQDGRCHGTVWRLGVHAQQADWN